MSHAAKGEKPKHTCLKALGIFFIFFVGAPIVIFIFSVALPSKHDYTGLFSATGVFIFGALCLWITIKIMRRIKFLSQHFFSHRIIAKSSFAVALIVLILFSFWSYNDLNFMRSVKILPLIQDSLAEVMAAKIMGDSIIDGYPVPGASFSKVKTSAEDVSKRLNDFSVPAVLADYRQAAVDWSDKISVAAENPTMWKYLAGELDDFHLTLSHGQAKKLFTDSINHLQTLKEFGDTAIKNKNRTAMRYVAAKLLVQKHWLSGIIYSKNNFFALNPFLALNFISPVLASSENPLDVPSIGYVAAVPCQKVCSWILEGKRNAHDMQRLWFLYRCDYCGKTTGEKQQQQGELAQRFQKTLTGQLQNQAPGTQALPSVNESMAVSRGEPYDYGNTPPRRKLCFRGVWGQTGAYCAEQALETVNEIEASVIDLIQGKSSAQDAWVESWADMKSLEAEGLTVGKNVLTSELSPIVQIFYDNCQGKGGIIGGSGTVKVGLPTTESGYTCEYKHNGQACWGFLTYSGGEYMGGNKGCPEKNLVSAAPAKETAPATSVPAKTTAPAPIKKTTPAPSAPAPSTKPAPKAGVWDGVYSASCMMTCRDMHCIFLGDCKDKRPDFSSRHSFSFQVRDNAVITGINKGYIYDGNMTNNTRILFPNNGSASIIYNFSSSGGKAVVSGNLMGGYDEGVARWDCSCDFSGTRTSK